MYEELQPEGFMLYNIIHQGATAQPVTSEELADWVEAFELTFPVLGDPEAEVWDAWNVNRALPSHIIIDRDLVVRVRDTGSSPEVLEEWREEIEELL